jgi:predicted acetyltransferase
MRIADTRAAVSDGRYYAAFEGHCAVGVAAFHDMRQWWHGRPLRMAGVGGVKVAPEQRGRGTGRALMTELLGEIARRGYAVSVLFPATAPLYRSLGWELAGGLYQAVFPARSLASLPRGGGQEPVLRRAGPQDARDVIAVIGAVHESARHSGPGSYDADTVRRWWLEDPDLFCYLAPDGFLAYGWHGAQHDILVRCALAGSPETTRALWSTVGSHASIARQVRAVVTPDDPVGWLTREPDAELASREAWMLRVVDPAAAVAGRGFPAAADLAIALRIDDAQLPANAGLWRLEVSGGRGSLQPQSSGTDGDGPAVPAGPVRLGARGFAALYSGVPMATLRLAGLATGGDAGADDVLDTAFAGQAFMLDGF